MLISLFLVIVILILINSQFLDEEFGVESRNKNFPDYLQERFTNTQFQCGDGQMISIEYVNDDFCDCKDGSDEFTTNACSNGIFFCPDPKQESKYSEIVLLVIWQYQVQKLMMEYATVATVKMKIL